MDVNQTYVTHDFSSAQSISGGMAVDAGILYVVDILVVDELANTAVVRTVDAISIHNA